MDGTSILTGSIWCGDGFSKGYITIEDGVVEDVQFGTYKGDPDFKGCIMPGIIDTHTHIADAGLKLDRRYTLEELVAPPNGLKHRYLKNTPTEKMVGDMVSYISGLTSKGVSRIIDFREGGVEGSRMLRSISPRSVILGRPISKEFDPNEIDEILEYADGIGIPSISDMPRTYIDMIAQEVHKKNKILALHVSERVREDIDYVISLRPHFVVHMVQATHSDIAKCVDNDIRISVCPRSNLYFGMRAPVNDMINAGADLSLGTDNAMLTPDRDIFEEMRVFYELLTPLNKERALHLKYLVAGGRKLLYENSSIESMTGKKADLIAIPCQESDLLRNGSKGAVRIGP